MRAADKNIAMVGTVVLDIKLGEALNKNSLNQHVKMSVSATKDFLKKFEISEILKDKIIICVGTHHGCKKFICMLAEICANADCYRFLSPRGIIVAIILFGRRNGLADFCLDNVEKKMDEKYKILSLNFCKEELESYYQNFKKFIEEAKSK